MALLRVETLLILTLLSWAVVCLRSLTIHICNDIFGLEMDSRALDILHIATEDRREESEVNRKTDL